eukprot:3802420-Amphidinium_carterae.1
MPLKIASACELQLRDNPSIACSCRFRRQHQDTEVHARVARNMGETEVFEGACEQVTVTAHLNLRPYLPSTTRFEQSLDKVHQGMRGGTGTNLSCLLRSYIA